VTRGTVPVTSAKPSSLTLSFMKTSLRLL